MIPWGDLIAGGVTAGLGYAKEAGWWKKLLASLRRKKTVLVLGASGAGKTQFVNSILDPLSPRLTSSERTTGAHPRRALIKDNPFRLIDTPGQLLDEGKRKPAIRDAVRKGVEGIVNVVSYGYHEAAEAGASRAVPDRGRAVARPEYLKERRAAELDLLSEWAPLFDETTTRWVLTVVTKADLWWPDDGDRIRRSYEQGVYSGRLLELRSIHSVVPYCSVIGPFYGFRTGGRFGDEHRNRLRQNLLRSLLELTGLTK